VWHATHVFRWSSIVGPAGAALLGGVIGGLVVSLVRPASPKPLTVEHEQALDTAVLEQRLSALEHQLRAQRPRTPRIVQPAAGASAAQGKSSMGGSDPAAAPAAPAPVVDDPVFEAAVRDIVERVDEERASEREVRSDERRREAAQGWTADFAKRAGLSEEQKTKVLSVVQDFVNRLRDQRNQDAGSGIPRSRQEWRARTQELRDEAERRLAEMLSREQLDVYNKLEEDQRIGGIPRQFFRRQRD